jgi:hypothetical protein
MLGVEDGSSPHEKRDENALPELACDRWRLARGTETGRVFPHEANPSSSGRVTEVDLRTFLDAGARGTEQQKLLRPIGGSVEAPIRT